MVEKLILNVALHFFIDWFSIYFYSTNIIIQGLLLKIIK